MDHKEWFESDFFGEFYMEGDDSNEGYLAEKLQTLRERTKEEVNGILKLLKLSGGEEVLDIPCGYGRHSIELASRNFKVTGVDINSVHLQKAKEKAEKQPNAPTFIKADMRRIHFQEQFDSVINMFYSFGFFKTDEENFHVLQNFYNALKPGGKLLMHTDVNIPRILAGKYKNHEERKLTSGKTLTIDDQYNPITKRIEGSWVIDGIQKDYSVRVFTKDEFIEWCIKAGFKRCEAYSSWKATPYSESSEDMIIIAVK